MIKTIEQLSKKDRTAIAEFANRVKETAGGNLISVAIFGSKVTGADTPESDIDILVLLKEADLKTKDSILNAAFDVNLKNDVYISPRVIGRDVFDHPLWKITPFIISLKTMKVNVL